jgi:hypothetical protein
MIVLSDNTVIMSESERAVQSPAATVFVDKTESAGGKFKPKSFLVF